MLHYKKYVINVVSIYQLRYKTTEANNRPTSSERPSEFNRLKSIKNSVFIYRFRNGSRPFDRMSNERMPIGRMLFDRIVQPNPFDRKFQKIHPSYTVRGR